MILEPGDFALIMDGPQSGEIGEVELFDHTAENYVLNVNGERCSVTNDSLSPVTELVYEKEVPPFGMSSNQTAEYVEEYAMRVGERIRGIGQEQYSQGDYQQFESMPMDDLINYFLEELEDICSYAAFSHIRLQRMKQALEEGSLG